MLLENIKIKFGKQLVHSKILYKSYWRNYGGLSSLISSLYFIGAVLVTIIVLLFYDSRNAWYDIPISTLPNIIGFAIAGYSITLTFIIGNEEKFNIDVKKAISAAFAHFVFVQALSLFFSIVSKYIGLDGIAFTFIGTLLFTYAIMCIFATTIAIYHIGNKKI